MANHYDILGVKHDATTDTIRRAFRRQAKALHPDKDSGTEAAMVRLNEAYDTLKDPGRRKAYDATLRPAYRLPKRPQQPEGPVPLDPFEFKARVFYPLDRELVAAMDKLVEAIDELAYDVYDDAYIDAFDLAVAAATAAFARAHRQLFSVPWPGPLASALNLYRQGLRQAEDAVEDFATFSLNYDTDVLVQGRSLLIGAAKLLDEARDHLMR
ncbi:MAG: J domain-containing protein [Candidatus Sericytochromatia bacterium]